MSSSCSFFWACYQGAIRFRLCRVLQGFLVPDVCVWFSCVRIGIGALGRDYVLWLVLDCSFSVSILKTVFLRHQLSSFDFLFISFCLGNSVF